MDDGHRKKNYQHLSPIQHCNGETDIKNIESEPESISKAKKLPGKKQSMGEEKAKRHERSGEYLVFGICIHVFVKSGAIRRWHVRKPGRKCAKTGSWLPSESNRAFPLLANFHVLLLPRLPLLEFK